MRPAGALRATARAACSAPPQGRLPQRRSRGGTLRPRPGVRDRSRCPAPARSAGIGQVRRRVRETVIGGRATDSRHFTRFVYKSNPFCRFFALRLPCPASGRARPGHSVYPSRMSGPPRSRSLPRPAVLLVVVLVALAAAAALPALAAAAPWTGRTFPAKYDLRSLGRVTRVGDQDRRSTCWVFAAVGSLESCLLPEARLDLSENHLADFQGSRLVFGGGALRAPSPRPTSRAGRVRCSSATTRTPTPATPRRACARSVTSRTSCSSRRTPARTPTPPSSGR